MFRVCNFFIACCFIFHVTCFDSFEELQSVCVAILGRVEMMGNFCRHPILAKVLQYLSWLVTLNEANYLGHIISMISYASMFLQKYSSLFQNDFQNMKFIIYFIMNDEIYFLQLL